MTATLKLHELNDETRAQLEERVKIGEAAKAMLEKLEKEAEAEVTDPNELLKLAAKSAYRDGKLYGSSFGTHLWSPETRLILAKLRAFFVTSKLTAVKAANYLANEYAKDADPLSEPRVYTSSLGDFEVVVRVKGQKQPEPYVSFSTRQATPSIREICAEALGEDPQKRSGDNIIKVVQDTINALQHPDAKPVAYGAEGVNGKFYILGVTLSETEFALRQAGKTCKPEPVFRHPLPPKIAANDCLMYLIKEAHLDGASLRTYVRDYDGKRYGVTIEREGE